MRHSQRTRHRHDHDAARDDADLGLLVGFTAVVMSDQRYRFIDRDRGQAFYARQRRRREADGGPRQHVLHERRADRRADHGADGERRRRLPASPSPARRRSALPSSPLARSHRHQLRTVAQDGQDRRHATATRSCSAPTRTGNPSTTATATDQDRPVRRAHRAADAVSAGRDRQDVDRRRGAPDPDDGSRGDSGVPVRHVLGRRPGVLRRAQLQLRRPRAHQRQSVSRRRAAARR